MIYFIKNNNSLETYLSEKALLEKGYKVEEAFLVSNNEYNEANGLAYIADDGTIRLGEPDHITKLRRIRDLKQYLADTDYVVIKIAEGVATKEDYQEILDKRQECRLELDALL